MIVAAACRPESGESAGSAAGDSTVRVAARGRSPRPRHQAAQPDPRRRASHSRGFVAETAGGRLRVRPRGDRRVPRAWRMSKSAARNGGAPAPRFCGMRWPGFVVGASRSAACSPTTARATSRDGSPASVAHGRSGIASRGPIRRARMGKRNASFKRCSGNGPIGTPSSVPRAARPRSSRTCGSTTTGVPTRASAGARRGRVSKRLPHEQPL